jgi:hypothetical protein
MQSGPAGSMAVVFFILAGWLGAIAIGVFWLFEH